MDMDIEKVWLNVRQSTTRDLLNRLTVYRSGMEADALRIIERELHDRGVTPDDIDQHDRAMRDAVLVDEHGIGIKCTFCYEPAIAEGLGWHRLWGILPLFPRWHHYCREHNPDKSALEVSEVNGKEKAAEKEAVQETRIEPHEER
jgi:hypothetical protein